MPIIKRNTQPQPGPIPEPPDEQRTTRGQKQSKTSDAATTPTADRSPHNRSNPMTNPLTFDVFQTVDSAMYDLEERQPIPEDPNQFSQISYDHLFFQAAVSLMRDAMLEPWQAAKTQRAHLYPDDRDGYVLIVPPTRTEPLRAAYLHDPTVEAIEDFRNYRHQHELHDRNDGRLLQTDSTQIINLLHRAGSFTDPPSSFDAASPRQGMLTDLGLDDIDDILHTPPEALHPVAAWYNTDYIQWAHDWHPVADRILDKYLAQINDLFANQIPDSQAYKARVQ